MPVSLAGAGVGLAGAALAWPHRRHRGHYLTGALLLLVASLLPLGALTDGSHPVDQMYGLALVAVVLVGLLLGNLADHRLLVRTLDAAGPGQLDAVAREMLDGGFHGLPGAVDPSSP